MKYWQERYQQGVFLPKMFVVRFALATLQTNMDYSPLRLHNHLRIHPHPRSLRLSLIDVERIKENECEM